MNKFDQVINNAKEEIIFEVESPWQKLVGNINKMGYGIPGVGLVSNAGWNKPVDSDYVYTLDPRGNGENIIRDFISKAGIQIKQQTSESFNNFIETIIEATPQLTNPKKQSLMIYDLNTFLPKEGKEEEWKALIGREFIDARRYNRPITIMNIIQSVQGREHQPSDVEYKAMELWLNKYNGSPATNNDMFDLLNQREEAMEAFRKWVSGEGNKKEYNEFKKEAKKSIGTRRPLVSDQVIRGLHNKIAQDFSKTGLYYLTPQEYETMKAGKAAAMLNLGKKALKFMGSTSPTVKYG